MIVNKIFNGILIVLVLGLLTDCTAPYRITDDKLAIELQKTRCYGPCPVYTISIARNGKGLFEGKSHVEFIGLFQFRLSKKEMATLREAFQAIGFFGLENEYYKQVMDLPTTYIFYNDGVRQKKIKDYYGAPEELSRLEQNIEEMVLSRNLKPVVKQGADTE